MLKTKLYWHESEIIKIFVFSISEKMFSEQIHATIYDNDRFFGFFKKKIPSFFQRFGCSGKIKEETPQCCYLFGKIIDFPTEWTI